jgi:hypothetical protein
MWYINWGQGHGKVKFINVSGNGPINVNFDLETPLSDRLKQEFLRI